MRRIGLPALVAVTSVATAACASSSDGAGESGASGPALTSAAATTATTPATTATTTRRSGTTIRPSTTAAAMPTAPTSVDETTTTTSTTPATSTSPSTSTTTAPPTTVRGAPRYELPGGGHVLFPGRRLVAIYGHPGDPNLGVLGEQPVDAAADRARDVAAGYSDDGGVPVIPTFEIITTVASSEPGPDGDYSLESSLDHVRPWVDAAAAEGFYVVLDLQPGYTDFLAQARRYEELLVQPHVGLALDPEWRLAPGERHLRDIGQVSADEVNRVASWLAGLTRRHALPQKLLLLHQFSLDMLPNRSEIQTHPELALVVQMDGLGSQDAKLETWRALKAGGPDGLRFGWKNFYDEDMPMRSPADTAALRPSPVYVSYQ